MTDEELVVDFALTRIRHPESELEEIAGMVVRHGGPERVVEFASRTLESRDELRGALFEAAVEHVLRVVLTLRDGPG